MNFFSFVKRNATYNESNFNISKKVLHIINLEFTHYLYIFNQFASRVISIWKTSGIPTVSEHRVIFKVQKLNKELKAILKKRSVVRNEVIKNCQKKIITIV